MSSIHDDEVLEKIVFDKFARMYSDSIGRYNNIIDKSFNEIFGLTVDGGVIANSEENLPRDELKRGLYLDDIINPNHEWLIFPTGKKVSFKDGDWTLNGVDFIEGNLLVTPYLKDLPFHNGNKLLSISLDTTLIISSYLDGSRSFYAVVDLNKGDNSVRKVTIEPPYGYSYSGDEPKFLDVVGYGMLQKDVPEILIVPTGLHPPMQPKDQNIPLSTSGYVAVQRFVDRFTERVKQADYTLSRIM